MKGLFLVKRIKNKIIISMFISKIYKRILYKNSSIKKMINEFKKILITQNSEREDLSFDDICREYGTVEEIANYYDSMIDISSISNKIRNYKRIFAGGFLLVLSLFFYNSFIIYNKNFSNQDESSHFISDSFIVHKSKNNDFYTYVYDDKKNIVMTSDYTDVVINEPGNYYIIPIR